MRGLAVETTTGFPAVNVYMTTVAVEMAAGGEREENHGAGREMVQSARTLLQQPLGAVWRRAHPWGTEWLPGSTVCPTRSQEGTNTQEIRLQLHESREAEND